MNYPVQIFKLPTNKLIENTFRQIHAAAGNKLIRNTFHENYKHAVAGNMQVNNLLTCFSPALTPQEIIGRERPGNALGDFVIQILLRVDGFLVLVPVHWPRNTERRNQHGICLRNSLALFTKYWPINGT